MKSISQTELNQAAELFLSLRDDPVEFARIIFGIELDTWQAEALSAVAAGKNISVRSGHGVGKTAMMASMVCWFIMTRPYSLVACTAPTQHQLHDLLWAEISRWLKKAPLLRPFVNWTATRVGIFGCEEFWCAVARSCAQPENLAGFHAEDLLYIVDEASGVPDEIMATVDGACTTDGAQIAMAGNPTRLSGYFYDSHHKARSEWHTIHVSSENARQVSKAYPETMAKKWGRDSDVYRVRVLGEFPTRESDSFISLELVEAAILRHENGYEDYGPTEIGLDVARFGDDETVLCVRKGGRVLPLETHRKWDTTQTAGRAIQLIKQYMATAIKIDDSGVGGGVTDMVAESCPPFCEVVPCNFGGAGDEDYDDWATIAYAHLRDRLQDGDIALPDDEDLAAQLTTRKYAMTRKGKLKLESKADMKKPPRSLPSPDRADAVALAFAVSGGGGLILTSDRKREATGAIP